MSGKKKLIRFEENKTFKNLFQLTYPEIKDGMHLRGSWAKSFFKNDNPIVIEVGCGKGEYTIGLAERHPEKNFIGIDIKGARLWKGCKTSNEKNMSNVAFIRTKAELLNLYFAAGEISEVWITFPDPQPKEYRERKRLTSPRFLKMYYDFMTDNGKINLKTDSELLFLYTLELIEDQKHKLLYGLKDIYDSDIDSELTQIQTFYEKKWLEMGIPINYIQFQLNHDVFKDKD
ncbi:MAG: tRNA (guanosine(46)-N7)-methyltransferase TrmB [Bacteroidales bacterium]